MILSCASIVRLAGLFGSGRHPGSFLSGKTLNSSALATVNMIHQLDAINALIHIATNNKTIPVFNAVSPHHPNKIDFYNHATKHLSLAPAKFQQYDERRRIITNDLLIDSGFKFHYENLFDAIESC